MRKNIIDENFVDELCKSGVWDVARVDLGSVNESAEVEDTDEISARELAEELFENLSDDVIYECIDILHSTLLNEGEDLDEQTLTEEENYQLLEDVLYEMDDDDFDPLINEALDVLDEEYDLSEATGEDLYEAVMDYIIEKMRSPEDQRKVNLARIDRATKSMRDRMTGHQRRMSQSDKPSEYAAGVEEPGATDIHQGRSERVPGPEGGTMEKPGETRPKRTGTGVVRGTKTSATTVTQDIARRARDENLPTEYVRKKRETGYGGDSPASVEPDTWAAKHAETRGAKAARLKAKVEKRFKARKAAEK